VLYDFELSKISAYIKDKISDFAKHPQFRTFLAYILNKLDATFSDALTKYRQYLKSPEESYSKNKELISKVEADMQECLLFTKHIFMRIDIVESYNCAEHIMDLIYLSNNYNLIYSAISVICNYFTTITKFSKAHNDRLGRLIHQISMIGLHRNLYNKNSLVLVELLSDDPLYKDLMASHPDKIRPTANKDNLVFEFFLNTQSSTESDLPNENIHVEIESLKASYPDLSPYVITKKIIEDKKLPIKEDSPIFDALFFRIKFALNYEDINTRLSNIRCVLNSWVFICTSFFLS
jgi:hypothetical protein